MENKGLKIAWLCHYSLEHLRGKIALDLSAYQAHPATWIHELAAALEEQSDAELHILTVSPMIPVDAIFRSGRLNVYAFSMASGKGVGGRWGKLLRLQARRVLRMKIRTRLRRIAPDIITIHGAEHTFTDAALDLGIPVLLWVQGLMQVIYRDQADRVASNLIAHEKALFRRIPHFITAQPHVCDSILQENPAAVFHALFYPVNPLTFTLPDVPLRWDLAFSGTLIERKGVEDLMEALALVRRSRPETTLCLVGPADSATYLDHLTARIADLGLSGHCFLAGRQDDHARVLELVKASRLFIYPSHADTAPLSLAEAMAMGKAVVATEVDGIPAMVKDGQDGLLVPPRNPERLAGAILQLLGDDRLQDELGRNARNTAQERFEAGRVARDYAALCRGLSGANGK